MSLDKIQNHRRTYGQNEAVVVMLPDRTIIRGKIVGKSIDGLIDHWIVMCDPEYLPMLNAGGVYPYSCFTMGHTMIKPASANYPFGCEN